MFETCPQCKRTSNGTSNRLVKDSCGHQKCRMCLLLDEELCHQCKSEQSEKASVIIKFESSHIGVITTNTNGVLKSTENGGDKNESKIVELKTSTPEKPPEKIKKPKPVKKNKRSIIIPNHIDILKDPLQYKCKICNKQFTTKSNVKYHIYCAGEKRPFQCNVCRKDFVTKAHLKVHAAKHSETKKFSCNICQKSFFDRSKLNRHQLVHSQTRQYVCSECGKALRSKESLKIHTLIHRGEKPFACRVCSMKFNNASNLNKHLISHSNEKAHMCDQCGKRFKYKWALTDHRRSHLRIKPYQCTTCCRAFINNKDLQRHQLIHLETKAYSCSICKTFFKRKDNLHRHIKNTHPGKKVESGPSNTVKDLLKQSKPVDNPNAIKVITASPSCKSKMEAIPKPETRLGTVINGPLKLAFKTSAFKNNYNIHRNCDYDFIARPSKSYDLAESVNICQKILSTTQSPPPRNVPSEPTSEEICQKILSPYPLHYETSFEHKKHAIIKNIKFKLPSNYTNIRVNDTLQDVVPLKPVADVNLEKELPDNNNTYTELKTASNAASVIVNSNIHWRRRTSQNLTSKFLEN